MEEKDKRVIFSELFDLKELEDAFSNDTAYADYDDMVASISDEDGNLYFYASEDYALMQPLFMVNDEGFIHVFDSWRPTELNVIRSLHPCEFGDVYRHDDEGEIVGINYRLLIRRIFIEVNCYWQNHYYNANYMDRATLGVIYAPVFGNWFDDLEEFEDD